MSTNIVERLCVFATAALLGALLSLDKAKATSDVQSIFESGDRMRLPGRPDIANACTYAQVATRISVAIRI